MGPVQGSMKQLQARINNFTANVKAGCGGFGVARTRQPAVSKGKGDTVWLECYRHNVPNVKEGCKWKTKWELTTQGWMLMEYKPHDELPRDANGEPLANARRVPTESGHNHTLLHDETQVSATTSCAIMYALQCCSALIIM